MPSHVLLSYQRPRGITRPGRRRKHVQQPWLLLLSLVASCCAYNDHRNPSRPLVWGVDLGNHNSVAATASKAGVEVILNDVAGRSTPSAVFFTGTARLVGEHTVTSCGSKPSNLVNNLKALLPDDESLASRSASSASKSGIDESRAAKNAADRGAAMEEGTGPDFWPPWAVLAYRVRRSKRSGGGGDGVAAVPPRAVVQQGGGELEVSARDALGTLLAHLERLAEADGGVRSSCVVAGVPSYYSRRQRRALLDAARVQGVPLTALIDEGQAAALAYGIFKRGLPPPSPVGTARTVAGEADADAAAGATDNGGKNGTLPEAAAAAAKAQPKSKGPLIVAFVDIGHTCTQVTVAAFTSAGLDILGRGCTRSCGAGAVERRVFDLLHEKAVEAVGADAAATPRATFRLARAAAAAVRTLSANTEARTTIECLDGETDVTAVLTRADLEAGCEGLAAGAAAACRAALAAAGLPVVAVAEAELLGGGSYIPLLQKGVEEVFGGAKVPVRRTMNAAESVATGCALAAARHSALFKLRPFAVTDRLGATLKVTYRWVNAAKSIDTVAAGICGQLLLTVPRGSIVPRTTETRVPLPVGEESGSWKLEVTVTEGHDAVAAFSIDVPPLPPHADAEEAGNISGGTARKGSNGLSSGAGGSATTAAALTGGSSRYAVSFALRVDEFGDVVLEHAREELLPPGRRRGNSLEKAENAENAEDTEGANVAAVAAMEGEGEAGAPAGLAAAVVAARARRRLREARQHSSNGGDSILGRSLHTTQTLSGLLSGRELEEARRREAALRDQDRAVADAAEARNALEDLLYATRRRLQPLPAENGSDTDNYSSAVEVEAEGEGDLSAYATAAEAAAALSRLGGVEEALLRGSLQGKQACQALAEELQELTALPEARKKAFVELLSVLEDFEQALLIREHNFYDASDGLSPAERRRLQAELAKAQGWVTASRNRLEAMVAASRNGFSNVNGSMNGPGNVSGNGASVTTSGGRYGTRAGKLPLTSAQVRRKLEQLMQAFDVALPAGVAEQSGEGGLRAPEAAPP